MSALQTPGTTREDLGWPKLLDALAAVGISVSGESWLSTVGSEAGSEAVSGSGWAAGSASARAGSA